MNKAPAPSWLEKSVFAHVAVLVLGSSWVFGGNIWWMRTALSIWASLGAALTVLAFLGKGRRGESARGLAWWLAPLALFAALALAGACNPSFRTVRLDGTASYIKTGAAHPGWPSTISAELTLRSLWFGAGAYLSAFNLAAVIHSRGVLRALMALIAGNTLVLAVFGTLQKLSGAGFYLGAHTAPNRRFFATFIYNNHWGAFMMLGLTTALGLLFRHFRRHEGRDLWHSPFGIAAVGALLIAASAPVSASRASTAMAALVVVAAVSHALVCIAAGRRAQGRSIWPPVALVVVLVAAAAASVGWLSYRTLGERYEETRRVIDLNQSVFGGREALYRDTWELACRQPVFGWGLDTYAVGFQMIRPYAVNLRDATENVFATAHSDWLQSLAENGFAGTALLVLMFALPLASLPVRELARPLTCYPLSGCLLVLLYSAVEFPFANAAVLITFCVLFFATIRHAHLTSAARIHHE